MIPDHLPIAAFDRKMTPTRARELRPLVLAEFERTVQSFTDLGDKECHSRELVSRLTNLSAVGGVDVWESLDYGGVFRVEGRASEPGGTVL